MTGAFAFGSGNASPGAQHNGPMPSLADDMSWVKGSHQIGFGGSIYQQRLDYLSGASAVGTAPSTDRRRVCPLRTLWLGLPVTFAQGTLYGFYTRQFYDALYVQDNWKVNLAIDGELGVRWEPYLSLLQRPRRERYFIPARLQRACIARYFRTPLRDCFSRATRNIPVETTLNYCRPDCKKFFPRLGLAWDPQGNGRMTIRAAYGMFGDRAMMLAGTNGYLDPPFGIQCDRLGRNISNPWATYAGGNPMPQFFKLHGDRRVRPQYSISCSW